MREINERITAYLAYGEILNPEMAAHYAVSRLLFDCREALAAKDAEIARLRNLFNLTRSDAELMAGNLSGIEWRTVSAILRGLEIKSRGKETK